MACIAIYIYGMYCIIICLSFLICEVQWFYWTQKPLLPVEKFTVRMPMMGIELFLRKVLLLKVKTNLCKTFQFSMFGKSLQILSTYLHMLLMKEHNCFLSQQMLVKMNATFEISELT